MAKNKKKAKQKAKIANRTNLINDLNLSLDRTNKLVERSDTKASIMITALSIIVGIVVNKESIPLAKKIIEHVLKTPTFGNLLYLLLAIVSVLGVFVGFSYLIATLIPRLDKKYSKETASGDESIYFFDSVSSMSFTDFTKLYASTIKKPKKQIQQLEKQVYINSEISSKKYRFLERGIFISFISIFAIIVLFVIGLIMLNIKWSLCS